jgi:Mn2+/Fe2+ NRAMP family transporter
MRFILILLSLAFALAGAAVGFVLIFGPDWTSILLCVGLFILAFICASSARKLPHNMPKWLEMLALQVIILGVAFTVFNSTFRFWK